MTAHPVLGPRSAGFGFPIACSSRTTYRGHPTWRLVHQFRTTQLHQTTRHPALSLESVTSVDKQVTMLVSVLRISSKFRTLHRVPEATTTTTIVASLPRRSTLLSPHLPPIVD